MTPELTPCPFCGGEAKLYVASTNRMVSIPCWGVSCEACKVMIGTVAFGQTDFFRNPEDAARAWNRRP